MMTTEEKKEMKELVFAEGCKVAILLMACTFVGGLGAKIWDTLSKPTTIIESKVVEPKNWTELIPPRNCNIYKAELNESQWVDCMMGELE